MKGLSSLSCLSATFLLMLSFTLASDFGAIEYDTFDLPSRTCEPITVELCADNGYNFTGGPNFLQEESYTQQDSLTQLYSFSPLIQSGCSRQLKSFLCTAYIPMCDPQVEQLIGPCRSVCENVKSRCLPILKQVGLPWPPALNCSVFPERNTVNSMCMEFPNEDGPLTTTTSAKPILPERTTAKPGPPPCLDKKQPMAYKYINATNTCQPKCYMDVIFTQSQKHFTEIWLAIWTSFALLFSLLTVITFFLDTSQFPYPKRPIIFLSLSYSMYAIGYLVRLIAGRSQVICDSDGLITQGLDNTNCAAIFLLLYYFSTAAALWWVIISLSWLLSAGLRWSHEAIELYSSYFHLVAWGVPAVQSITIIVLRDVSGDELTGLCFVGTNNPNSVVGFVIGPISAYLFLGTALVVAGYVVSFCHDKKQNTKSDESIEVLMVRIGLFSLFYTVPTVCSLACYFYEYLNITSWEDAMSPNTPSIEIFTLKTFSCLLPGITSGFCIMSCKNFDTWSLVCGKPCLKKYSTSTKKLYNCGSSSTNSNNNNSQNRHYMPVKSMSSPRQGTNSPPSQYSTGKLSRSHEHKHPHPYHHHLLASPVCGPSTRYPGEYHV